MAHRPFPRIPAPLLTQIALVSLCVAGGLLISAQWQTQPTRVVNPVQPFASLTDTRDALQQEQQNLQSQIDSTTQSIDDRTQKLAGAKQVDAKLLSDTSQATLAAGLIAAKGRGIIVTLDDSRHGDATSQAIAHAADLRDIVSLLRATGAEAISINGERVVVTTSIDCIVNTILVNQTRLSNPYVITAIGNADELTRVLNDTNILQDLHRRVINEGVIFTVVAQSSVTIPAYHGLLPGSSITVS